jgi:hypothetical protein
VKTISILILLIFFNLNIKAQTNRITSSLSFIDSGQKLGTSDSKCVALGDIDNDYDLDAFVANGDQANKLWVNDGKGYFVDSGQSLGKCGFVVLQDLDKDDDLDAFYAKGGSNEVWLNNGSGFFKNSGQLLGNGNSKHISLGDVDGDGDLDAVITNWKDQPRKIWLNNGKAFFIDSAQELISAYHNQSTTLADLDNDSDLDIFSSDGSNQFHKPVPNRVWINDGNGLFTDSGQRIGASCSNCAKIADLDNDGDLDAFIANTRHAGANPANTVWLNDGKGNYLNSGQCLGNSYSTDVQLYDFDNDGDLDAYVANYKGPDKIWLNDGKGNFIDSGFNLTITNVHTIDLGDLDNDHDSDVFVAVNTWYRDKGSNHNRVFINDSVISDNYGKTLHGGN